MSNQQLANRVLALIEETASDGPVDLNLWRERSRAVLADIYGSTDHDEVRRFETILVPGIVHSAQTIEDGSFATAQVEAVHGGVAFLKALHEQLEYRSEQADDPVQGGDPATVFVVHGRNDRSRNGMFAFLRALGLKPLEWSEAVQMTSTASPYIGQILDQAFGAARAVVVLLTPDEITYLRREYAHGLNDPDHEPAAQARPNVLFEAGMAFGRHPESTILVELGQVRPFSDVAGRHAVRMDGSPEKRKELAQRLDAAGCAVNLAGTDWLTEGDLQPPPPPGEGLPLGRRVPESRAPSVRLDARYMRSGKSSQLQVTNLGSVAIHDLDIELPEEAGPGFNLLRNDLPLKKLPPGKTANFHVVRAMAPGSDHFELTITGRTPDGEDIEEQVFISAAG